MSVFGTLFDEDISVAEGDPRVEWPHVASWMTEHAVPKRQREFSAGRALARRAMQIRGLEPLDIDTGQDRAPIWPDGLTGSITHCDDLCAAAIAATSDGIRSIGLDVEPAQPIEDDLVDMICRPEERIWLNRFPSQERGLWARAFFSAKECTYKCQYQLSRKLFDFDAIEVTFRPQEGRFLARFEIDAFPFSRGTELCGRFAFSHSHIATGMVLHRDHPVAQLAA